MKPQELRINNFVLFDNDIMGIKSIKYSNKRDNYFVVLSHTNRHWVSIDELKGVPLDDWWLIKFGFRQEEGEHEDEWIIDIDKICKLMLHKDDFSVLFTHYDSWVVPSLIIKHVHQLQNLFYSLTGEELTLDEKAKNGVIGTQTPPSDT